MNINKEKDNKVEPEFFIVTKNLFLMGEKYDDKLISEL